MWHKIVVKAIIWKEGIAGKGIIQTVGKISAKEWKIYSKHLLGAGLDTNKAKIKLRLKESWQKIKKNGGFE